MDCAKVAAARVVKPNQTPSDMRGVLKILKKLPPFFAVPTTAGTGSECTIAAVISNPDTHEKNSIMDPVLRPKYAILDPELTVGLPPHITSTTGMDRKEQYKTDGKGRNNCHKTCFREYRNSIQGRLKHSSERKYACRFFPRRSCVHKSLRRLCSRNSTQPRRYV